MNKPVSPNDLVTPKVTTGPISGSRKIHVTPDSRARPACAAARDRADAGPPTKPPLPIYDTSGPYTDIDAVIDVEKGLKRARTAWVEGTRRRRGI